MKKISNQQESQQQLKQIDLLELQQDISDYEKSEE